MTDTKPAATSDDKDDDKPAKASVLTAKDGDGKDVPVADFATFAEATEQAKALGKGYGVTHVGTAFHVEKSGD